MSWIFSTPILHATRLSLSAFARNYFPGVDSHPGDIFECQPNLDAFNILIFHVRHINFTRMLLYCFSSSSFFFVCYLPATNCGCRVWHYFVCFLPLDIFLKTIFHRDCKFLHEHSTTILILLLCCGLVVVDVWWWLC